MGVVESCKFNQSGLWKVDIEPPLQHTICGHQLVQELLMCCSCAAHADCGNCVGLALKANHHSSMGSYISTSIDPRHARIPIPPFILPGSRYVT